MDIQAKDRLTGAVILVALVVLLVPELLSGPGTKPVGAVAATTADGPALRSYTVELGDEAHSHGTVAPTAPAEAAPAAVTPTSTPALPPPALPSHAQAAPAPPTREARQAQPQAAPARSEAAAEPEHARPAAAPEPAAGGTWTVQLGSFASRTNAERLVHDLKTKGFAAFLTESANGGRRLYRVRVGPPSDHAGAQALGAKLRAAGHPGSLTAHP